MEVLKLVHKTLSGEDISRILGREVKILKYADLDELQDSGELVPNAADYCVIIHEDRPDRGHWAGLLKYNGLFEHFGSYGNKVDAPLHWINMKPRRALDVAEPTLTRLLNKEAHYIYNNVAYKKKIARSMLAVAMCVTVDIG